MFNKKAFELGAPVLGRQNRYELAQGKIAEENENSDGLYRDGQFV